MEAAVSHLEALFVKADSDLDYASRKLETEFGSTYDDHGLEMLNPKKLLARLAAADREVREMHEEYDALIQEKELITTRISKLMFSNYEALRSLQISTSVPVEDMISKENLNEVSSLLSEEDLSSQSKDEVQSKSSENISQRVDEKENMHNSKHMQSVIVGRTRKSFAPVTEEEFSTISPLVRGRLSLDALNEVFEALHSKLAKTNATMSVQALSNAGLKITGATGEAKLKVLRGLKLIELTKDGVRLGY